MVDYLNKRDVMPGNCIPHCLPQDISTHCEYDNNRNIIEEELKIRTVDKKSTNEYEMETPAAAFAERCKELHERYGELLKNNRFSIPYMLAVCGAKKTEFARAYKHLYSGDYDGNTIWINADSRQTMTDDFKCLYAEKLGFNPKTAHGVEKRISIVVEEVYEHFSKSKCLFVFDNAHTRQNRGTDDRGIDDFLPLFSSCRKNMFVLITSRNQLWDDIPVLDLDGKGPKDELKNQSASNTPSGNETRRNELTNPKCSEPLKEPPVRSGFDDSDTDTESAEQESLEDSIGKIDAIADGFKRIGEPFDDVAKLLTCYAEASGKTGDREREAAVLEKLRTLQV